MVDITREKQSYVGEGITHSILSVGNHVTCERQQVARDGLRHLDRPTGIASATCRRLASMLGVHT